MTISEKIERDEEIRKEHKKGSSIEELARKYNITLRTVQRALDDDSFNARKVKDKARTKKKDAIVAALEDGQTIDDVAKSLKITKSSCYSIGYRAGVCGNKQGYARRTQRTARRDMEIFAMYNDGTSVHQIAKEYGLAEPTIYLALGRARRRMA